MPPDWQNPHNILLYPASALGQVSAPSSIPFFVHREPKQPLTRLQYQPLQYCNIHPPHSNQCSFILADRIIIARRTLSLIFIPWNCYSPSKGHKNRSARHWVIDTLQWMSICSVCGCLLGHTQRASDCLSKELRRLLPPFHCSNLPIPYHNIAPGYWWGIHPRTSSPD